MKSKRLINPFEYDAAVNFATDELIEYFVEDHNYSRFIQSTRNIFIVGERGCGKSMSLLFNSFQKQLRKAEKNSEVFDFLKIGIYVPCTNVLFFKREFELVNNEFKASVLSEHFFVLSIAFELSRVLASMENVISEKENKVAQKDLEYILNIKLASDGNVFLNLSKYFQKLSNETQLQVNNNDDNFSDRTVTFFSLIIPLMKIIKNIERFKNSHFLFLIDDAHDLNKYQILALNSWIAYRDHSDFSFKVAIAKVRQHTYVTATGGAILEGHDFLKIDMEKPFQNKFSDFGQWAKDIVERRLMKFGIENIDASSFFPVNPKVAAEMKECEEIVRKRAEVIFKNSENRKKQISDYVYKRGRAEYFKSRAPQANLPVYSGWDTIVHVSTGVIRNLLSPCYWMFDKEYSTLADTPIKNTGDGIKITHIRPHYQDEIIKEKSQELWHKIDNDLFYNIDNCSTKQAEQIKNLFNNLMLLFRERLKSDASEPRAITFTISGKNLITRSKLFELDELLRISREAQILYERVSSAKDAGQREIYYVPNRLLFPIRGLDVVGQHARVSIKASELFMAAVYNRTINSEEVTQQSLFENEP